MSIDRIALALGLLIAATVPGAAQAPMSAIEWLDDTDSLAALRPREGPLPAPGTPTDTPDATNPAEAPVSDGATVPQVAVKPLDQIGNGPVGLMPTAVTGLPEDLWRGSDPAHVADLLKRLDLERLPAMQALLYSLLLTETLPPASEDGRPHMLIARIDTLVDLGSVDPALALIEAAGSEGHPDVFRRYFDLALLTGNEGEACARMAARPDLAPNFAARVYCLARMGDWKAAMLTYASMRALGEFDSRMATLLELYLEPELFEDMPPLAPPAEVTPLIFRLEEAIGQPLSTANLPRAYASADLRNVSGWKAKLEAVERLARTGALSENQLIGAYTERRPAASGGIWDRVAAVQAFDAAMKSEDTGAITDTITDAWSAMRAAELEVPFARLYGEALSHMTLDNPEAQRIALRIALLSPAYEAAAGRMQAQGSEEAFLTALARGDLSDVSAPSAQARAVAAAFAPDARPLPGTARLAQDRRLGEAIVNAMHLYTRAAEGESKDATQALATLRLVGLEDTARRAALQMLILDRRG